MSGDIFGARTGALNDGSNKIRQTAESFKSEYEKMFLVVDTLVGSEWTSPAATVIANRIFEQRPNLEAMYNVICGYADYCARAASKVEENEEDIITRVGGANNG